MSPEQRALIELTQKDRRFSLEAYIFVQESLSYAHTSMSLGSSEASSAGEETDRHMTGQQLCGAIREYAREQYGYMAKAVLNNWGLQTTGDFGDIVYNLIEIGMMKKSENDRREDFDDVYDFETAFVEDFQITRE